MHIYFFIGESREVFKHRNWPMPPGMMHKAVFDGVPYRVVEVAWESSRRDDGEELDDLVEVQVSLNRIAEGRESGKGETGEEGKEERPNEQ